MTIKLVDTLVLVEDENGDEIETIDLSHLEGAGPDLQRAIDQANKEMASMTLEDLQCFFLDRRVDEIVMSMPYTDIPTEDLI